MMTGTQYVCSGCEWWNWLQCKFTITPSNTFQVSVHKVFFRFSTTLVTTHQPAHNAPMTCTNHQINSHASPLSPPYTSVPTPVHQGTGHAGGPQPPARSPETNTRHPNATPTMIIVQKKAKTMLALSGSTLALPGDVSNDWVQLCTWSWLRAPPGSPWGLPETFQLHRTRGKEGYTSAVCAALATILYVL